MLKQGQESVTLVRGSGVKADKAVSTEDPVLAILCIFLQT